MNPYDFVRVNWSRGVPRRPAQPHNRFSGQSGKFTGTITTSSPLFIPVRLRSGQTRYKPQLTNRDRDPIIPGTSLKGLFRSLVETIGNGCWWFNTSELNRHLPDDFRACHDNRHLCVACRMFGMIKGDALLMGHVGFGDAVCKEPVDHPPFHTIILSSPKPHHRQRYLDEHGRPAGRKFYYHHSTAPQDVGQDLPSGRDRDKVQNQHIRPVGTGSVFKFSGHFDGLARDELDLLLYAMVLEDEVCHKVGYGKPAGLGSAKVRLDRLELIDYQSRYDNGGGGICVLEGEGLEQYLNEHTKAYREDKNDITLTDLRHIWRCEGYSGIQYPSWH